MESHEKFWDIGPHDPLPVEKTFHEFVRSQGGCVISDILPGNPDFMNSDYSFNKNSIFAELKEVETEFLKQEGARKKFGTLMEKLIKEDPEWKPEIFGGKSGFPDWFNIEFIRLARPGITRILKKANTQIKETKKHFNANEALGILFFVNDGFTGLAPNLVNALACNALANSYSSIDCFIYITLNRYIEVQGSNEPKLIWTPSYGVRADDSLVNFVDNIGREWFNFLDKKIGGFTSRYEGDDSKILDGSKAIIIPK